MGHVLQWAWVHGKDPFRGEGTKSEVGVVRR
jgi:hypothetical protein